MLCPWCMHYGAEDDEYVFDSELYCGICARQMPASEAAWTQAFQDMNAEMRVSVEEELNRIAVSRSGIRPELRAGIGEGLAALAALRSSDNDELPFPEAVYVRWVRFACTYYVPQIR